MEDERNLAHVGRAASGHDAVRWDVAADLRLTASEHRRHAEAQSRDRLDRPLLRGHQVFQKPAQFTLGDAPRAFGGVRTPWAFSVDLSLSKQFVVREEMNIEVRMEARNAFNHPVFGTPNTSVDDPAFGTVTYTSNTPREVQLAVKFNF